MPGRIAIHGRTIDSAAMSPLESLREALRLLHAQPVRSGLTLFGLVWGTAAVIFLLSWAAGLETMLDAAFQRAGKNLVQSWPGRISEDFSPVVDRRWLWYTPDDVAALRAGVSEGDLVGAEAIVDAPASFHGRALSLEIRGVEPEGQAIRDVALASGRPISREDVEHRRRVLVIGHRARERLLGAEGRIGSWVRLDGTRFQVIGVLDRVGTQLSRDGAQIDDQVWVPLSVHLSLWPNPWIERQVVSAILVRAKDRKRIAEVKREMRRILSGRLGVAADDEEAVPVFSPLDVLERIPLDQQNGVNLLIALTTLLVGGLGILAMMLDSVEERRAEIGIRLALGARQRDVILQFLWEGIAIVALGGAIGVLVGAGGAWLLGSDAFRSRIPPALRDLVPVPELSPTVVLLAVMAMAAVAVVAALVPAWRAAGIDPAETLRVE
jgi:putative ABC transport system permease protein